MVDQDIINLVRETIDAYNANDMNRLGATVTDDFIYERAWHTASCPGSR